MSYKKNLPPIPFRLKRLPVLRGYPVPWFVAELEQDDGSGIDPSISYDFRVADPYKRLMAAKEGLCYICGQKLGRHLAFPIGPMCAINRISAEPPSHRECAEWSIKACPFLLQRQGERRTGNLPEVQHPPGEMIRRQPGVVLLWMTKSYAVVSDGRGGILFRVGDPTETLWYREGREATRSEVLESIESGYPQLLEIAERQGHRAVRELGIAKHHALRLVPAE